MSFNLMIVLVILKLYTFITVSVILIKILNHNGFGKIKSKVVFLTSSYPVKFKLSMNMTYIGKLLYKMH